jgi:hypothetical protein
MLENELHGGSSPIKSIKSQKLFFRATKPKIEGQNALQKFVFIRVHSCFASPPGNNKIRK